MYDEARFWRKVNKDDPSGCWLWTGAKYRGYGYFRVERKGIRAHRYSYELVKGNIPSGLILDHLCRNKACVNPQHLEPVTIGENVLRGTAPSAVNAKKSHCVRGHRFSEANTYINRGRRYCKTCRRSKENLKRKHRTAYNRLWRQRKKAAAKGKGKR